MCGARATINVRLHFYALLSTRTVNTQLTLCGALDVTGRLLIAMAGRL
jgi:hypothetical protein